MLTIHLIESHEAAEYVNLTFAPMRAKLPFVTTDGPLVAIAATGPDGPIGLVYGEIDQQNTGHVRSLFVKAAHRNRGIARSLLRAVEEQFRKRGCLRMQIAYLTGKPSTEALERVLSAAEWDQPLLKNLMCRLDERIRGWRAFQRATWLADEFELFPWTELSSEDRVTIERTQAERLWIPPDLVPFQYEKDFEPLTSFGIRYHGQPVGWMITHRLAPDTIRYTCSFIQKERQGRSRILAVYHEAYRAQSAAGVPYVLFMVPAHHPTMVKFVRRHWEGKFSVVWENRECCKSLKPQEVNNVCP